MVNNPCLPSVQISDTSAKACNWHQKMDLNKWNTNFVWNVSTHDAQTASSLPFSSGLVRGVHARASGEAARRAKRRRVSRFAQRTTEKRETARSLHGAY